MISVANPYLDNLPYLSISTVNGATTLVRGSTPIQVDLQVKQTSQNNSTIEVDLRDTSFIVSYDSRFLTVTGYENNVSTPTTGQNYISTVRVRQTSTNSDGSEGSISTFRVSVKGFNDDYYNYYATATNSGLITTFINISGTASGAVVTQQININKNSSV
jgi:hypothetical protein